MGDRDEEKEGDMLCAGIKERIPYLNWESERVTDKGEHLNVSKRESP